jgi:hypothetical protein
MITLLESGPQPTALGKRVLSALHPACAPLLAVLRCDAEPKPYGELGSETALVLKTRSTSDLPPKTDILVVDPAC